MRSRLQARERLLQHIRQRLETTPHDAHQLFLLREHTRAREVLLAALRAQPPEEDPLLVQMDRWVDHYLQATDPELPTVEEPATPQPLDASAFGLTGESTPSGKLRQALQQVDMASADTRRALRFTPEDVELPRLKAAQQQTQEQLAQALDRALLREGPPPDSNPSLLAQIARFQQLVIALRASIQRQPELPHLRELLRQHLAHLDALQKQLPPDPETAAPNSEVERLEGLIEQLKARIQRQPHLDHLQALLQAHQERLKQLQPPPTVSEPAPPDAPLARLQNLAEQLRQRIQRQPHLEHLHTLLQTHEAAIRKLQGESE
jgi:hypothetical protein